MKRPAFQFYPADWRKDNELRVCSIAARGLWIDMMAIMHEGDPYGHLTVAGCPVTTAQLASLVGVTPAQCKHLLAELETHRVFSRTDAGVIFSRRMVKDEHLREVRAAAGKLGGNPALKDAEKDNRLDNQKPKQKPTPSSAVAVAPSASPAELQLPLQKPSAVRTRREPAAGKERATWLTPAGSAYEAVNGEGSFDYGQAARLLAPLHKAGHSPETIGAHLAFYLDMRGDEMGYLKAPAKRGLSGWVPNLRAFRLTFDKWNPHGAGEVAA